MLQKIPKCNTRLYKKLAEAIRKVYEDRVICLVIHGSSLHFPLNKRPYSDIDAELILRSPSANDYWELKQIISRSASKLEIQLRYLPEIQDRSSLLRVSSYKVFLFFAYSNGLTMIGKNIYTKLTKELCKKDVRASILLAAQIEYKNIRKSFLSNEIELAENYKICKSISRFFLLLLILFGKFDYRQLGHRRFYDNRVITNEIKNHFSSVLSENDNLLLDKHSKNQLFDPLMLHVVDKIYTNYSI